MNLFSKAVDFCLIGACFGIVSLRVALSIEDHLIGQVFFISPQYRIFTTKAVDRCFDHGSNLHGMRTLICSGAWFLKVDARKRGGRDGTSR